MLARMNFVNPRKDWQLSFSSRRIVSAFGVLPSTGWSVF
jgi:hypothetical protein